MLYPGSSVPGQESVKLCEPLVIPMDCLLKIGRIEGMPASKSSTRQLVEQLHVFPPSLQHRGKGAFLQRREFVQDIRKGELMVICAAED